VSDQAAYLGAGNELDFRYMGDDSHQRALQVAAMDHEIGRFPASLASIAERHTGQLLQGGCVPELNRLRAHRDGLEQVEHAQPVKNMRGVGRQLDAAADRFDAGCLLEQLYGIASLGKGKGGTQPGDARSGDDDLPGASVVH
jgi:hypothetical protein